MCRCSTPSTRSPPGAVTVTESFAAPAAGAALNELKAYVHTGPEPVPVPSRPTVSVGLGVVVSGDGHVSDGGPATDGLKRMM